MSTGNAAAQTDSNSLPKLHLWLLGVNRVHSKPEARLGLLSDRGSGLALIPLRQTPSFLSYSKASPS